MDDGLPNYSVLFVFTASITMVFPGMEDLGAKLEEPCGESRDDGHEIACKDDYIRWISKEGALRTTL